MALGVASVAAAQNASGQVAGSGTEEALPGPRVSGRFVDTEGRPLAGVAITGGWRGLTGMGQQLWTPLGGLKADGLGRFVIELPSEAYLEFSAAPPGLARKRWSVQWLFPGTEREMGDLVLEPEAVVTTSVVDAHGDLLTHGWSVECTVEAAYEDAGEGQPLNIIYRSTTPIDATRGSVRLANLPRGRVQIVARGPLHVPSEQVEVHTVAGMTHHVPLLYSGPDPSSIVVLDVQAPEGLVGHELCVRAADDTRWPFTIDLRQRRQPGGGWSMQILGTLDGPGPWTLESTDPSLRVVAAHPELRPGASLTVELVGSASLALEVVEAETGRPIEAPTFELLDIDASSRRGSSDDSSATEVVGSAFMNLVPGVYRVSVSAPTFAEREHFVQLAPHTAHSERIELLRPVVYTGRVLDTNGAPVARATVSVERGHVVAWSWSRVVATASGEHSIICPPFASTTTRADGRFEVAGLALGPLTFRVDRLGMPPQIVWATHEGSAEQVLSIEAPTRIEVRIDFPAGAHPTPLGVLLDAPEDPKKFAELDPAQLEVIPASSDEPGSMHAVLLTTPQLCRVVLARAEGTGEDKRWIPISGEAIDVEVGKPNLVRFDGHALLPATVRLRANATASPAATSLRGAWLALGLQRVGESGESGEAWRRWSPAPLPPPPASLTTQPLTVSVKVPAGNYVHFAGGPGWRWIASEPLSCTLLQTIDVAVDVDPPLVAREVQLAAEDGTPLVSTGAQLWFDGVHPLPPGERLISVSVLTDESGRFRAVGPIGATLHARVERDAQGAPLRARPSPTLDFEPRSDGSAVMALGADALKLTVRTP